MNKHEWKARKQALKRKQYKGMVLDAYDRLQRADTRDRAERRAEVEREARKRI